MGKRHELVEDVDVYCWWCGREEWLNYIDDVDTGTRYYWCHRHEDEVLQDIQKDLDFE